MEIRYSRGSAVANFWIGVIAAIAGVVIIVIANSADMAGWHATVQGAGIGALVAGGLVAVAMWRQMNRAEPIVTIGGDGIRFHLDGVGLLPWSQIDRVGTASAMGNRQFAVFARAPVGSPGFFGPLMYLVTRRRQGDLYRISMPLSRLDATWDDIRSALARHEVRIEA